MKRCGREPIRRLLSLRIKATAEFVRCIARRGGRPTAPNGPGWFRIPMDPRKLFADERHAAFCVFCGALPATRERVRAPGSVRDDLGVGVRRGDRQPGVREPVRGRRRGVRRRERVVSASGGAVPLRGRPAGAAAGPHCPERVPGGRSGVGNTALRSPAALKMRERGRGRYADPGTARSCPLEARLPSFLQVYRGRGTDPGHGLY